jgi:YD repeat-containing protein
MLPGTWTTYAYNANDTVQSVTDARNVTVNYLYNARRLVTNVSYNAPANITATAPVSFLYDAAGNRMQMVDGIGTTNYNYDQFSRLTSEAKPLPGFSSQFNVGYEYSQSGQLKSVTDHFGQQVSYGFDLTGRLSTVNSANNWGGGANTAVISGRQYRAFGALKQETYGSGFAATATHNARLQVSGYTLTGANQQAALQYAHQYAADGALKFSDNQLNGLFDRAYAYDQAGRLTAAYTGPEANDINNGVPLGTYYGLPYREQFQYDALNQLTATTQSFWGASAETTPTSYLDGRIAGWEYDASGRVTRDGDGATYKYDAAGRLIEKIGSEPNTHAWYTYNGEGRMVKQVFTRPRPSPLPALNRTSYYLGATVLGGLAVAEMNGSGVKTKGNIFAGGGVAATADYTGAVSAWQYREPLTGSDGRSQVSNGQQFTPEGEYDAAGVNVGLSDPVNWGDGGAYVNDLIMGLGLGNECSNTNPDCAACYLDGFATSCGQVSGLLESGAARPCPDNDCGQLWVRQYSDGRIEVGRLAQDPQTGGWTFRFPPVSVTVTAEVGVSFAHARSREITLPAENVTVPISFDEEIDTRLLIMNLSLSLTLRGTEEKFTKAYKACQEHLANAPDPGITNTATILQLTGIVDPMLLAVTWYNESGGFNARPTNGIHGKDNPIGDIGPGQVYPGIWNKSPYTDNLKNPFGTNLGVGQKFNGDPFENLILTARALSAPLGRVTGDAERAKAAGLYKAGSETGPGYQTRVDKFNGTRAGFDAFFNCLAKFGFK